MKHSAACAGGDCPSMRSYDSELRWRLLGRSIVLGIAVASLGFAVWLVVQGSVEIVAPQHTTALFVDILMFPLLWAILIIPLLSILGVLYGVTMGLTVCWLPMVRLVLFVVVGAGWGLLNGVLLWVGFRKLSAPIGDCQSAICWAAAALFLCVLPVTLGGLHGFWLHRWLCRRLTERGSFVSPSKVLL